MHLSVFCLLSLAAFVASVPNQGTPTTATTTSSVPTVTLDYSTVTLDYSTIIPAAGNDTLGYYKYQNIRYAAVPTGDLRWDKPHWPPVETMINNGSLATSDVDCASSEDCLYLDVWAPANSQGKKLPVMVWTYGGGFTGGSKSQNTPEGLFTLSTEFIFTVDPGGWEFPMQRGVVM